MKVYQPIDVILILGQSNAVGCTAISTLSEEIPREFFDNVYLYQEGNFSLDCYGRLQKGIGVGMGNNRINMGIEYGIAKALRGVAEIALIRYALGGSNLYFDWRPSIHWEGVPQFIGQPGYSYRCAIRTVANGLSELVRNGYSPQLRAVVWMQGESDADKGQKTADAYGDRLKDLAAALRAEFRDPKLPILVGEIATNPPQCNWSDSVREGQRCFCKEDPDAVLISTEDLPIGHDGLHFDGDNDLELGLRFGRKLREILTHSENQ